MYTIQLPGGAAERRKRPLSALSGVMKISLTSHPVQLMSRYSWHAVVCSV